MLDLLCTSLFLQVANLRLELKECSNKAISGIMANPSVQHKLGGGKQSAVNSAVHMIKGNEWCIISDRQCHDCSIAGPVLLAYLCMHVACHSHVQARSVLKLLPFSV